MKKIMMFMVMVYLLTSCDTKKVLFNGAFGGEFVSYKEVNLKTNQSKLIEQRFVFRDTLFLYSKNKTIVLANVKTTYNNAREGKSIIKGYDFDTRSDRSMRLIYVDWWNNPDSKTVKASVLMMGEYDEKADTIDVYYTQIR
jgi:hypothetical protein